MPAIISIMGKKGSQKAKVIEKLIAQLSTKGYRVGVLKHLARPDIEIDEPGKDTYRYRTQGAEKVILAGDKRFAIFANLREPLLLNELLSAFNHFDIVFLEGYFQNEFPKIEVYRKELGDFLLSERVENVIAICSDAEGRVGVPAFSFEELDQLAHFIETSMLKKEGAAVS